AQRPTVQSAAGRTQATLGQRAQEPPAALADHGIRQARDDDLGDALVRGLEATLDGHELGLDAEQAGSHDAGRPHAAPTPRSAPRLPVGSAKRVDPVTMDPAIPTGGGL